MAQVALAALNGDKSLAELAQQFDLHPDQIDSCRRWLLNWIAQIFGTMADGSGTQDAVKSSRPMPGRTAAQQAMFQQRMTTGSQRFCQAEQDLVRTSRRLLPACMGLFFYPT